MTVKKQHTIAPKKVMQKRKQKRQTQKLNQLILNKLSEKN